MNLDIIETKEKIGNREYIVTKTPVLTGEELEKLKSDIESQKGVLISKRDEKEIEIASINEELKALDQRWADLF